MNDKYAWEKDLVAELQRRAAPATLDRATLAELRRGLGHDLGRVLYRVGGLFRRVPSFAVDDAVLVAALFASHPSTEKGNSLGRAFHDLRNKPGSHSVEKRFVALLDSERTDLTGRLRQAVSLLKAKDIAVDWQQLLTDVRRWEHPSRRVQRTWARDFWADRPDPPIAVNEPSTTI